ncbi:hypothetical protein A2715_00155 [Candidatus Woesebacteria bacterium RIFCSPHIGHO2_01_FULL_39_32]|uniref:Uncharacterized protein n=2 Tax=Candidatus Woeseibacteriota TaxID=1752722 RepID=A0A0G0PZQ0_9BACT|nr:MAG: hypothetical protein UT61_C0004G0008 [Candidatus Woesebacteria bacterium GW2011_GWA1_39_8]OGM03773.1 MAG: hypothetical protein A2124_00275 [Candidatus Woesebacteria bacterium GWB1_37_5]OGM24237.1 MAG: hypothetical protein A2715_00155 [Candidatus Woesebacteria bacterium RIFCSPHIGHO2_01_FULL_39_32]OGM35364.1 MAG: hypothetical protein A3F01_04510 [Candidatus Woesebacteria bacterium RIFCSPHIGHO2_12_FULL_38_11]OGM65308.1 MAG: hypothetical protein A2893_01110 [Candidatus Woesebacteria bacteri
MSNIFYDHLIILTEVETEIKNVTESPEEKEELWNLVDEIIHHRILGLILDALPREHHEEFLIRFHQAPHDERHLKYLNEKTEKDIEEVIREEIKMLEKEILEQIRK